MQQETELHKMAKAFVEHTNSGVESDQPLWDKYFSSDIVSVESDGRSWSGLDELKKKHKEWFESVTMHSGSADEMYVGKDSFSIKFSMDVEPKDGSWPRMKMTEVGVYEVKDGKVVREEFLTGEMQPV
ncbi:MAG: nuclear transport factor 2 family protein [Planctomycetota bacterium]